MVQGLETLLEKSGEAGLAELRDGLHGVLSGPWTAARLINEQRLKSHVYRLHFEDEGRTRSVIVKRLDPDIAQRNQFVTERWLPAVGLSQNGPPLLGVAAERCGRCVWHIYEDLGDCALASGSDPEPGRVEAAVELIAQVHARFAEHALLAECRLWGGDLGMYFYTSSVRDAIRCLESLRPPHVELSPERSALRDRLNERLLKLSDEQPFRAQMVAKLGGPETLLHGDLWTTNTLVYRNGCGLQARLIDWDRAAVGPAFYDLSTFLITSPVKDRTWILDLYRHSLGRLGWHLPSVPDLNLLFSIAESARLANCIIWRSLEVSQGHAESALEELASLEQWLETLEPVLPS